MRSIGNVFAQIIGTQGRSTCDEQYAKPTPIGFHDEATRALNDACREGVTTHTNTKKLL